jgi:DNA-binding transcriptional MocR family regulator
VAVRTLTAYQLAGLLGDRPLQRPAHRDLSARLRLLTLDGRLVEGVRLPSERDLAGRLQISRSTVAAAYAALRADAVLESRPGSGNYLRGTPVAGARLGGVREVGGAIVMTFSAAPAAPGVADAYGRAFVALPQLLAGHGYFPDGLEVLRERLAAWYGRRGLPTDPDQIIVTGGALPALNLVGQALLEPGDRVLVESPTYANGLEALRGRGARLVPVPMTATGWDLDAVASALRQAAPRLAYLIPDFQNPTGSLMAADVRRELAAALRRERCIPVVDETMVETNLDAADMPAPFASWDPETITLGSSSKAFWAGLRTGWIRAPRSVVRQLVERRATVDLGSAAVEQLVLAELLVDPEAVLVPHRARLRAQREHLLARLATEFPDWRVNRPPGGQTAWVELPSPLSSRLVVAAAAVGLIITPGHRFFPAGGGERHLRLPFTAPEPTLTEAVSRLRRAWDSLDGGAATEPPYELIG